ncbi:MAG: fibronectin type III domain-containing protein [Bacteroidetes bacterium]|nr:fibronectin type III domain-containing protein [Bacteroidota bacterium]
MRKVKVIINFLRIAVPSLIEFARNVVTKMTGNTNFPTPDVPPAQITAAAGALETKYNAAQGGGKQQTADMHQARKALEDLLHKQGLYVERIANGNEAIILGSGYGTSKQPAPALHPDFTVVNGKHEGEMILKHKAVKGAAAWVWELCPDPLADEKWVVAGYSSQTTFTAKGLKPGTKYWFRAAYIAKDGLSQWCDPFSKIAM